MWLIKKRYFFLIVLVCVFVINTSVVHADAYLKNIFSRIVESARNLINDYKPDFSKLANSEVKSCGDGIKDKRREECDGESFCNEQCRFKLNYTLNSWQDNGSVQDFTVKVGDKIPISSQLNIRIERIDNYFKDVGFSIWGKDNFGKCLFVSASGRLALKEPDHKFREFTDAFIELISMDEATATIRKFTGSQAGTRCQEIVVSHYDTACSFYPGGNFYYVENNNFRFYFRKTEYQKKAEYTIDVLDDCLNRMNTLIPETARITPYKSKWSVYQTLGDKIIPVAAADYERIAYPPQILMYDPQGKLDLYERLKETEGKCSKLDATHPHELTHMIYSGTSLQPTYDTIWILPLKQSNDPALLNEGMASFMATFLVKQQILQDNPNAVLNEYCEKEGITPGYCKVEDPEELKYSSALKYGTCRGYAGICLFYRVEDDCGEDALMYMFNKIIDDKGLIMPRPTIFKYLSDICDLEKIKVIMKDFGFDESLLTFQHTYPAGSFGIKDWGPGCIE